MGKRNAPILRGVGVKQDRHETMLSEMHDALYSLGSKIRKPYGGSGDKLLPKGLAPSEPPEAAQARTHIETLHKLMKQEK